MGPGPCKEFLTADGMTQLRLAIDRRADDDGAGTTFLMWLGEQIDEYGIGNGISLLIMAGILARMPAAGFQLHQPMIEQGGFELGSSGGQIGIEKVLVLADAVRRRDRRRGLHHARPAAHSHAERQARSRAARLRRYAAVPAATSEIRPA